MELARWSLELGKLLLLLRNLLLLLRNLLLLLRKLFVNSGGISPLGSQVAVLGRHLGLHFPNLGLYLPNLGGHPGLHEPREELFVGPVVAGVFALARLMGPRRFDAAELVQLANNRGERDVNRWYPARPGES